MISELTNKAYAVLDILLNAQRSLTATEITSMNETMNINTVQSVLRTLLKNNYIEVAQIVYSGNVLCRSYQVSDLARAAAVAQFAADFRRLCKNVPLERVVAALVESDESPTALLNQLSEQIAVLKKSIGGH